MKQVDAYKTGSLEIVQDLKHNAADRIKHDASKLMLTLQEQLQQAAVANAQLARTAPMNSRSDQTSDIIERQRQHLYAMLDDIPN